MRKGRGGGRVAEVLLSAEVKREEWKVREETCEKRKDEMWERRSWSLLCVVRGGMRREERGRREICDKVREGVSGGNEGVT